MRRSHQRILHHRHITQAQEMVKEFWQSIPGYPGYQVSKTGKVVNHIGNELTLVLHHKGYLKVQLSNNAVAKMFFVHRLVAMAFVDNPDNLPQVNHLDGNKQNNYYINLEWCTQSQNIQHAWDNGLMHDIKGENNHSTKINNQIALSIRQARLTKEFTRKMLAEKFGVTVSLVKDIRSNRSWTHI